MQPCFCSTLTILPRVRKVRLPVTWTSLPAVHSKDSLCSCSVSCRTSQHRLSCSLRSSSSRLLKELHRKMAVSRRLLRGQELEASLYVSSSPSQSPSMLTASIRLNLVQLQSRIRFTSKHLLCLR